MSILTKTPMLLLRGVALLIGLFFGFIFVQNLLVLVSKNSGEAYLLTGPISFIFSSITYLIAILVIVFQRTHSKESFIKRVGIFFAASLLCSFIFLAAGGRLYTVAVFRAGNAPVSIFEVSYLEQKLGFQPFLPSEPLMSYQPSWKEIRDGELTLFYSNGLHTIDLTQSTEISNSNSYQFCKKVIENNTDKEVVTQPIVIVGQSTQIYYTINNTPLSHQALCIPLADRIVSSSLDPDNKIVTIERMIPWLEKLK